MKANSSPHVLGQESIGKLLVEYSIPAIIGMTVTSLYHVIDSIFIGQGTGALGIAGIAVTLPLMNLNIAFCTLVAIGGATISSIYMGQKDIERTTYVLHNVLILLLAIGIVLSSIMYVVLDEILLFFGASHDTLPYAKDFMQIILIGSPVSFIFIGLNNVMRATGYPRKAMYSALLSVGVNLILAPIFIFSLKWGMKGAATATVISQFCGMIWVLAHFCRKESFIRFQRGYYTLQGRIVKSIFAIGLAPFLLNVCACVVVIFINMSLRHHGGDMAIGAYGIINRMLLLVVMIIAGLNQGMQPILGYNYGAREFARVRKTLRYGILSGTVITTIGFVAFIFFPQVIVSIFSNDAELNRIAIPGLQISSLVFPVVGAQIVITNFFQSIGKSKVSIILSLSRQMLFLIPGLIILPNFFGTEGVWMSMPISDMAAFIFSLIAMHMLNKKMKSETKEVEVVSPTY